MANFIILTYLLTGLFTREDYYNAQDENGRSKFSSWQLIRWLFDYEELPYIGD